MHAIEKRLIARADANSAPLAVKALDRARSRAQSSLGAEGGGAMSKWIPEGWHTITPRIVVRDVAAQVEFLRRVFGATGELQAERPTVMTIGDSMLMVSGVGPRPATPAFLYVYVEDTDDTYRRALEGGARSLEEPQDLPYGDRRAMVEDPFGNVWQIATPKAP